MKPAVVVDVGNTRVKWGLCSESRVEKTWSLPGGDLEAWRSARVLWGIKEPRHWAVCGVNPPCTDRFVHWLRNRGDEVWVIDSQRQLPVKVGIHDKKSRKQVGLDRLLNAVAALGSYERYRSPAVVVDAGTAVTVDWVDREFGFRGGAILPGVRLMAKALHEHTALLPLVEVTKAEPPFPGRSTEQAIEAGVYYAVAGGVNALIRRLTADWPTPPHIFVTGGDARLLQCSIEGRTEVWPEMTLEGIRLAALAQT